MNESSSATGVSKSGGRIERTISFSLPKRCAAVCACANSSEGASFIAAPAIASCASRSLREIMPRLYSAVVRVTSHTHVPDRVSALELFFDLVFVFTITEVAEVIVHHPDAVGIGHAVIELTVLAWMFGGYAWLTNTAASVATSCRVVLLAGMAGFFICALGV